MQHNRLCTHHSRWIYIYIYSPNTLYRLAGEDPFLAAEYVAHFVSGIQGDQSDPLYDAKWTKGIATWCARTLQFLFSFGGAGEFASGTRSLDRLGTAATMNRDLS